MKISILIVMMVFTASCGNDEISPTIDGNPRGKEVDVVGSGYTVYNEIIDSCDYLIAIYNYRGGVSIIHKENCKNHIHESKNNPGRQ
jgi:hypothetical protein